MLSTSSHPTFGIVGFSAVGISGGSIISEVVALFGTGGGGHPEVSAASEIATKFEADG